MSEIIRMEKIAKRFGSFEALAGIDLAVESGERVVIVGPSGSGKSTLIRCINQLERPDDGRVLFDGRVLGETPLRGEIGMVFQQFNLFPHLTILGNCMLAPVHVRKTPRAEAEARARQLLARVHIAEQADKYPAALSGGQQQRAAIARALSMTPRVMLFDEPTSALDPGLTKEVLDTMVELAESGMTMIIVTHEMAFARKIAHRMIYMEKGAIIEEAPPERFFTAPADARTRAFLGDLVQG
jgi:ABC-type polar amino acid transport system ATPase subunit